MAPSAAADRTARIQGFTPAQIGKIVSDTQHVANRLSRLHDELQMNKFDGELKVDGGQRARAALEWLATFSSRLQEAYDMERLKGE